MRSSEASLRDSEWPEFGAAGLGCLVCLVGALYAVPWAPGLRKSRADFVVLWKTRVVLQVVAAVWLVSQWLRLELLWNPGSPVMPPHVTAWAGDGTLCRLYLTLAPGLLQPLFLLTSLLACRAASRPEGPHGRVEHPNGAPLLQAALLTCALLVPTAVASWLSAAVGGRWEESRGVLHYFFGAYIVRGDGGCARGSGAEATTGCVQCVFPAAVCVLSVAASALFLVFLWRQVSRMRRTAVNKVLLRRMSVFRTSTIILVVLGQATQSATLADHSSTWVFQTLWIVSFWAWLVLALLTCHLLVLQPTWDIKTLRKLPAPTLPRGSVELQPVPHDFHMSGVWANPVVTTKAGAGDTPKELAV